MQINHKRVVRIMREDNLLGLQPQRFKVTTNSNHKFEVYLNLAARMKRALPVPRTSNVELLA
jgi:hypothetical protein